MRVDSADRSLNEGTISGDASASTETVGPVTDGASESTDESAASESPSDEEPMSAEEQAQAALSGSDGAPVNVMVLGDDTSNLRSEWVQLWGADLAERRPVTVVQWDEAADVRYSTPDVISDTGEGEPLTIWNASRTGADISSVTARLPLFLDPVALVSDPDVVVLNLGVNDSADEAVADAQELVNSMAERLGDDTPVVLVRQGRGGASAEVDEALVSWAEDTDVVVWDVNEATSAQEWASLVVEQSSP